jgi:DNA-binding NarL/FixJ family response regulator
VSSATILLVDDHDAMRGLLRELIGAAFPACRVLEASSGEAAVELCRAEKPEVVVMDILLPGMTGIQATRRIKALLPHAQVVMHSSNDASPYRDDSAAAGASAFVAKSQSHSKLVPAIAALLSPTSP